jgi:hypothetical protein
MARPESCSWVVLFVAPELIPGLRSPATAALWSTWAARTPCARADVATMEGRPKADLLPWAIAGTYLEACNCEAICPCRRVGGRPGGRSTNGICTGALSWRVSDGHAGDLDLSGLGVVLVLRYDDDEPGSPWSFFL